MIASGLLRGLLLAGLCWTAATAVADEAPDTGALPPPAKTTIEFKQHIQPLFAARCSTCHGAEESEGDLRLHRKADALQGGSRGQAWVPGKSAESRLIHAVAGIDPDLKMPPEGEGTPLTAEEIGLLRAWIDQGAVWPDDEPAQSVAAGHWAFQPIVRPPLPAVKNQAWVRTPIDAFILAKLESHGIQPSPEADKLALLRRVHLDVLGLPPSPQAIEEFLRDEAPGSYERMVDRLLDSPHYGERWGRHWLDLARYADSDGYEKDNPRPNAWRYRNWVIDALNADMPFDQFTREQLAGDLLPDAGVSQRLAVGFHRNTLHNTEGGTDPEEDRVKKTVDRTNTLGSVWLGLSVGCAQCHSHKYDPISHREYYSLYAFFNQIDEVNVPAPTPQEQEAYNLAKARFDQEHQALAAAVREYEAKQLPAALAAWEAQQAAATTWRTLVPDKTASRHGAEFQTLDDRSLLPTGKNVLSDAYTVEATVDLTGITAIRLEVLPDDRLPAKGPGRSENGNFVLTTLRVEAAPADGSKPAAQVPLQSAVADFSQSGWDVAGAINGDPRDGWAISPQFGQRHVAVFHTAAPVGFAGGTRLSITLDSTYHQSQPHNLGRFRLSVSTAASPGLEGLPEDIAAILAVPGPQRTEQQQAQLKTYYAAIDPELKKRQQAVAEHGKQAPKLEAVAQSVAERSQSRPTHVQIRGDFLRPGAQVQPQVPAVLPPIEPRGDRPDRLDLANWLFDPRHPLTARVTVNRIWQRYFGRGLVPTVDDFGTQGDKPSHPELLDWLADEFRAGGWRLKAMHRLILNSATYRQSSRYRRELVDTDPYNALLARQNRRRVEAEVIRDLALAASGLLVPRVGGPSVFPPQPAEYSKLTYANSARWTDSSGPDRYRRGMYTFFRRTSPYPMLATFDAPDSTETCTRRQSSNTPLQALTLWNDAVFFECAQALARRIVGEAPSPEARLEYAFLLTVSRKPTDEERAAVEALLRDGQPLAEADPESAGKIIGGAAPQGVQPAELAAWVLVARTLLNVDEFITRE